MDLARFARDRLKQLRLSPRDRARASSMAESYIAQHKTPSRQIHFHDQVERVLQLPPGQLAKFAHLASGQSEKAVRPPLLHRRAGTKSQQSE